MTQPDLFGGETVVEPEGIVDGQHAELTRIVGNIEQRARAHWGFAPKGGIVVERRTAIETIGVRGLRGYYVVCWERAVWIGATVEEARRALTSGVWPRPRMVA